MDIKVILNRCHRFSKFVYNWFQAKGEIALGVVEGLNSNAELAIRKARGFRTYEALETALYHQLGHLPELQFPTDSVREATPCG